MLSLSQVQLIENYTMLANKLAHNFHRSSGRSIPFEDFQADAYLALVKAALSYDSSVAGFTTHAYRVITNHLISVYCKKNRGQEVSFSELGELHGDLEEALQAYSSKIAIEDEGYISVEYSDKLKRFLEIIGPVERFVFFARAANKSQTEIARLLRVHIGAKRRYRQPDISAMLQDLKKKYVVFMNNC